MSEKCRCVACQAYSLGMVSELDVLDRIAAAIAAEREACAVLAEDFPDTSNVPDWIAEKIRARGAR